ncbi:MAG: hypothetical protein JSS72_12705 [Armatimonadetes bacterium]|nr:hypothetical protein [Armatimonadota bacterium]
MILYRKSGLLIEETWFGEPDSGSADIVYAYQLTSPNPSAQENIEFHTLVLDLRKEPEDLIAGFASNTRNEVRRSEKDGVTARSFCPAPGERIQEFVHFYSEFAAGKGLEPVDPQQLSQMAAEGRLCLSQAVGPDGAVIVWHSYYLHRGRARLLLSASLFRESESKEDRALIGRANRFLHFEDMKFLRSSGCDTYDFGGWYHGTEDEGLLRINKFKEGFGGSELTEYHAVIARTMKGRLGLAAKKMLKR